MAAKENYSIIDTETTGLSGTDVIIQLGIADLDGNILLDTFVKPSRKRKINEEAQAVHGITMEQVKDAKQISEVWNDKLNSKIFLAYNAEFDARMLRQSFERDGMTPPNIEFECIMKAYAQFVGQVDTYYDDYKWQKLPDSKHSAALDCLAALNVLKKMAGQ